MMIKVLKKEVMAARKRVLEKIRAQQNEKRWIEEYDAGKDVAHLVDYISLEEGCFWHKRYQAS